MSAIALPAHSRHSGRGGPLQIRAFEEPDRHVLELSGELDLGAAPTFEEAARRLARRGGEELLVDISEVGFIDSMGLRAILSVKGACERAGCAFTMTHGSEQTERVFELTRLLDRLPFRRSRQDGERREIELWPSRIPA